MKNLNGYIKKLEKGMEDKLFFLRHIDMNEYSLVVEFGCAMVDYLEELSQ